MNKFHNRTLYSHRVIWYKSVWAMHLISGLNALGEVLFSVFKQHYSVTYFERVITFDVLNFCQGRGSYALRRCTNTWRVYTTYMSPALNRSFTALQMWQRVWNAQRNNVVNFYPELPQIFHVLLNCSLFEINISYSIPSLLVQKSGRGPGIFSHVSDVRIERVVERV